MPILRIEHPVPSFDGWKAAFDSDPVGRERSGVRRYRILRSMDDPNYVMIDLEFDDKSEAEALLAAMREVWSRVEGTIMWNPQAHIVEVVESKKY
jgi:ribosomal protein L35AE/L33A